MKGAAIYYESTDSGSYFTLVKTNVFKHNHAEISGGAIQFSGKVVVEDENDLTFENNSAPYGLNWASYGVSLIQTEIDTNLTEEFRNRNNQRLLIQDKNKDGE